MAKINVYINKEKYDFDEGITLLEITNKLGLDHIMAAFINNEIVPLDNKLTEDTNIIFVPTSNYVGNRIYQKGLLFVLIYAFKELFGYGYYVKSCHSIDKAIKIKTNLELNSTRINALKDKMREIIEADMPIKKCTVSRKEARNYFLDIKNESKADTFIYNTNSFITLYKLGDMYDYFFSKMPVSTGMVKDFDLYMLDNYNFVLQFPYLNDDGKIPEYVDRNLIIKAFDEDYKLATRLGIFNSGDLNKTATDGTASDVIKLTELVASARLLELAKDISDKRDKIKLVLISGPSCSGKTTTSKKLAMYLKIFGLNPKYLSIDDYFLDREKTPKFENGDYNFESVEAINTEQLNKDLSKMLNGEEVEVPSFNFIKGISEYEGKTIKLESRDILIMEGIHAINEELTSLVDKEKKYKVYVSPLTDLNIDDHNMISNNDLRLLRRIIRDNRTRGYSAEDTIASWRRVRDGEEKYLFPYQNDVDYVYNTSLIYEIGVLKLFAEPLLFGIDNSSLYYEEVVRLLNFLDMFVGLPTDEIPNDSILREFIGSSYFE